MQTKIPGDTTIGMKYLYIAVTGTMGSGKTTAVRLLSKYLKYHLIEENFGDNAFLPRFYKEMKRWAFHSQTFFLMEKITQTLSATELLKKHSVIQDVPIYQDVFSYAKAQHVIGNMDDAEWRLYQKIYRSLEPYLPKPDVIVYLKTDLEHVKKRISGRSRNFEQQIPDGYLELLDMLNEQWMRREMNGCKLITVDTDGINLARNQKDIKEFIETVKTDLK